MNELSPSFRRTVVSPQQAARLEREERIAAYKTGSPICVGDFPGNYIPEDLVNKPSTEIADYLVGQAFLYREDFELIIRDIARAAGAKSKDIDIAAPKSPTNIIKKGESDYEDRSKAETDKKTLSKAKCLSQVRDVARATIYVDDEEQVIKACNAVFSHPRFVCGKDQFRQPNERGYRSAFAILQINDNSDQPFHAEIQIKHRGMERACDLTHEDYDKVRDIDRRYNLGELGQYSPFALGEIFVLRDSLIARIKQTHDQAARAAGLDALVIAPDSKAEFTPAATGTPPIKPEYGHTRFGGRQARKRREAFTPRGNG